VRVFIAINRHDKLAMTWLTSYTIRYKPFVSGANHAYLSK